MVRQEQARGPPVAVAVVESVRAALARAATTNRAPARAASRAPTVSRARTVDPASPVVAAKVATSRAASSLVAGSLTVLVPGAKAARVAVSHKGGVSHRVALETRPAARERVAVRAAAVAGVVASRRPNRSVRSCPKVMLSSTRKTFGSAEGGLGTVAPSVAT